MTSAGHAPPITRCHVVIAGVSTRAAAESAARAGYAVTAVDAFGDLDQHSLVRGLSVPRDFGVPFTPRAAARAARTVDADAAAYLSSFENSSPAVRVLGDGRALWGNPPAVLQRVRDPELLARAFRERGIAAPTVRSRPGEVPPEVAASSVIGADVRWMMKPRASGGGHGVRPWRRASRVPRGSYLQEHVDGTSGSVVFVADGQRAVVLGLSRQLAGDPAFGATGLRYCGSILAGASDPQFAHDARLLAAARVVAQAVVEEFGLIGVNGVDLIARDGVPYPIEVNPRYSASMELVERAYGISVFGAHANACAARTLPDFDVDRARCGPEAVGKAIVFARRDVRVGDTRGWLADESVRDVPHPGEAVVAGRPVCTVFATAPDSKRCYAALVRRAERVYDQLASWEREAA